VKMSIDKKKQINNKQAMTTGLIVTILVSLLSISQSIRSLTQTKPIPIGVFRHGSTNFKRRPNLNSGTQWKLISSCDELESNICRQILQILNLRLDSVLSGERSRQFARRYRGVSGTIVSAHGGALDVNDQKIDQSEYDFLLKSQQDIDCLVDFKPWVNPAFPNDISSLDMYVCGNHSKRNKNLKMREPSIFELSFRAMRLGINFFPTILTSGVALVSPTFRSKYWYKLVSNGLSKSGPAFIKWGQWSSTRPDMFPIELCDALTELHADAPKHSWRFTQRSIEESLSIPKGSLFEVFEHFEKEPIASGSIAQVHRAVLRPPMDNQTKHLNSYNENDKTNSSGAVLAIKVRHPNVESLLDYDFRLMKFLASIVDRIPTLSWLNIKASVEQFSHTMAAQAHLDVEAHHLEVLNHNFRNWKHVGFPRPIYASDSVIIETFEKGAVVTDVLSFYDSIVKNENGEGDLYTDQLGSLMIKEGHELIPTDLAKFIVTTGASLYLKMMIEDGLMHADLHPGNIIFRVHSGGTGWEEDENGNGDRRHDAILQQEESSKPFVGSITLVDAGMVAKLTPEESNNFIGLMVSLGEGNAQRAARSVLNFSSMGAHDKDALSKEQKEAFTDDMIELFDRICKGYGTNVDVGEVLRGVLNLIRIHKIRIDANYATLVVNALCVISMAYKFVPEYNVLDASKPLFEAYSLLCSVGDCGGSKTKQSIMKTWMPLLYFRKNLRDNNFFRDHLKRRHTKHGIEAKGFNVQAVKGTILSVIKGACLIALSTKGVNFVKEQAVERKEEKQRFTLFSK